MLIVSTLLGYLNRVFKKDPQKSLAMQFSYAGAGMSWTVADNIFTVSVTGGIGAGFSVDLEDYTLLSLATYVSGLAGFTVGAFVSDPKLALCAASVILDGSGNQDETNGGNLYAYTSILYTYLNAAGAEIDTAETAVGQALLQMSILDGDGNPSASGEWLDVIGGYYNVPRMNGEFDNVYGPRIIAEVLQPRGNNIALAQAIQYFTGQTVTVVDVVTPSFSAPLYNDDYTYNGAQEHNSTGSFQYNLFDVTVGYDLVNGGDPTSFLAAVNAVLGRLRDAGTHLRSLLLSGSAISETRSPPPTDAMSGITVAPNLADALTAPTDGGYAAVLGLSGMADTLNSPNDNTNTMSGTFTTMHDGSRSYSGGILHWGNCTGVGGMGGWAGWVFTPIPVDWSDGAGDAIVDGSGNTLVM